jgi:hypothetical protein
MAFWSMAISAPLLIHHLHQELHRVALYLGDHSGSNLHYPYGPSPVTSSARQPTTMDMMLW